MSKITVLGVDPGINNCGAVVISHDDGVFVCEEYRLIQTNASMPIGARLQRIRNELQSLQDKHHFSRICLEGASYGSTSSPYTLGAVHGLVLLFAHENNIPITKAVPTQVKKFATGDYSAKKESVLDAVLYRHKIKFPGDHVDVVELASHDISDASAMALIALGKIDDTLFGRRCELEVLRDAKEYHNF